VEDPDRPAPHPRPNRKQRSTGPIRPSPKADRWIEAEPGIASSDFLKSLDSYTKTFSPAWDTVFVSNPKAGNAAAFPFNYVAVAPLGGSAPDQAAAESQKDWAAGF
jgi:hypothetical protein